MPIDIYSAHPIMIILEDTEIILQISSLLFHTWCALSEDGQLG
jgi:hypothetical protein